MPSPTDPRDLTTVADGLLAEAMRADLLSPSMTAAVFDRSGLLSARSRGAARLPGSAATTQTVYRIASMSKSFCAAAVLLLVERGELCLDDALASYLPQFRNHRDERGAEWPVTLRMLLTNSSGLPEDNAWADEQLGLSRATLLDLLASGVRFGDLPGAGYQYSNLGFGLLALVVEHLTGEVFTEFVRREFLVPLGLGSTGYLPPDAPDVALGYSTFDSGATWVRRPFVGDGALAAAGGLFSTVGDIAAWAGWLSEAFEPGTRADEGVLSRRSRRLMQTLATPIATDSRLDVPGVLGAGYGMGLVIELERGQGVLAQHSGGLPGFSSHMRWHTDSGVGVVVLANADGVSLTGWARALHAALLRESGVPARRVVLWPQVLPAVRALDEMLRTGADFARCAELFSDNVATDMPLEYRRARALEVFGRLGGIAEEPGEVDQRLLWAAAGSSVSWRLPCHNGDAVVSLELTPWRDTAVQYIDVASREAEPGPAGMLGRCVPVVS